MPDTGQWHSYGNAGIHNSGNKKVKTPPEPPPTTTDSIRGGSESPLVGWVERGGVPYECVPMIKGGRGRQG